MGKGKGNYRAYTIIIYEENREYIRVQMSRMAGSGEITRRVGGRGWEIKRSNLVPRGQEQPKAYGFSTREIILRNTAL